MSPEECYAARYGAKARQDISRFILSQRRPMTAFNTLALERVKSSFHDGSLKKETMVFGRNDSGVGTRRLATYLNVLTNMLWEPSQVRLQAGRLAGEERAQIVDFCQEVGHRAVEGEAHTTVAAYVLRGEQGGSGMDVALMYSPNLERVNREAVVYRHWRELQGRAFGLGRTATAEMAQYAAATQACWMLELAAPQPARLSPAAAEPLHA